MATKRINASILLDEERYAALKAYAAQKGVDIDGAITFVLNTGLSRIQALSKHAQGKGKKERAAARAAKPKAEAKPKAKAAPAKAAKAKPKAKAKAEAKPVAKAAPKKAESKKAPEAKKGAVVAKRSGAVSRLAPQRTSPVVPATNSQPASSGEVAQA